MFFYWLQLLLISDLVIQITSIKQVSQKCTTILQLKFLMYTLRGNELGNHRRFFFHEIRHWKVRKVTDPGFWIKVQMNSETSKSIKVDVFRVLAKILFTQIYMLFASTQKFQMSFNFLQKNSMFGKNLVLELRSRSLKANQNARSFKLENPTNKLRYEFELLDVTRVP